MFSLLGINSLIKYIFLMDINRNRLSGAVGDFYAGRSVFITGGTGFLGKVIIEKLLRSCNRIGKIYILARAKKGQSAQQRVEKLTEDLLFDRIKANDPDSLSKLVPVIGDLEQFRLIKNDDEYAQVIENVSVVFHVAATVKFNEPLKTALKINLEGTQKVLDLCRQMKELAAFVHVSTAFCNSNKTIVDEVVYPPETSLDEIYEFAKKYGDDEEEVATFLKDTPNTYTFTKRLAEHEVYSNRHDIPSAIIRPSVVTSIWKDPLAGWLDNWNGTAIYFLGISKGQIRFLFGDGTNILDIIPVDVVVNLTILAATRCNRNDLKVYNCCSGPRNAISFNEIGQKTIDISLARKWNEMPWLTVVFIRFSIIVTILQFIFHFLPAFFMDCWLRIQGKRPKYVKLLKKYDVVIKALNYFAINSWQFRDDNVLHLVQSTGSSDREEFYCDAAEIDWTSYIHKHCIGIYKYLLKDIK